MNRLAKKKKYYVRVRGDVTNNGKNYYGAWSKVKTIRTENKKRRAAHEYVNCPFKKCRNLFAELFVEIRVVRIEVFLVQIILQQTKAFTETGRLK